MTVAIVLAFSLVVGLSSFHGQERQKYNLSEDYRRTEDGREPGLRDDRRTSSLSASLDESQEDIKLPQQYGELGKYVIEILSVPKENLVVFFLAKDKTDENGQKVDYSAHEDDIDFLFHKKAELVPLGADEIPDVSIRYADEWKTLKCSEDPQMVGDGNVYGIFNVLICDALIATPSRMLIKVGNLSLHVDKASNSAGQFRQAQRSTPSVKLEPLSISVCQSYLRGAGAMTFAQYASDYMAYYHLAGISHVYWLVSDKKAHDKMSTDLKDDIESGFLSLVFMEPFFIATPEAHKSLMNNMCLYHAKNFDDMMYVLDWDELPMVDTSAFDSKEPGKPTLPGAIQTILDQRGVDFRHLCYMKFCATMMFPRDDVARDHRAGDAPPATPPLTSLDRSYPLADSGAPGKDNARRFIAPDAEKDLPNKVPSGSGELCGNKYGYLYPKSALIVPNTGYTALHDSGSCSIAGGTKFAPSETRFFKEDSYTYVHRQEGVMVEHYVQMFSPERYNPAYLEDASKGKPHCQAPSKYYSSWAPLVKKRLAEKGMGAHAFIQFNRTENAMFSVDECT